MEYIDNKATWETVFTTEIELLNQKMATYDVESLSKSRLRLSIENRILDWKKYEEWARDTYGCCSIKENTPESSLKSYAISAQQAFDLYSTHSFWNSDILPVCIWENQLIVFGLQYHPHLQKIPNHIFILAPPRILNYFAGLLLNNQNSNNFAAQFNELGTIFEEQNSAIDGLASDVQNMDFDFKNISTDTITNFVPRARKNKSQQQQETETWDLISERFPEYVFEAKKQFDAFVILQIIYDVTQLYKMDPDLEKLSINEKLFEYSLRLNNPFKEVIETNESQVVTASELGLDLLNYNNICITAIKRQNNIVGYFMGFKNEMPSKIDVKFLEELSKETTSAQAS